MAAGLGFKTFVSGDVLTAADTNGYLMQGVWVFANAAARTAAVTSPQEGNASFLKDTNSLEIYDGASWVAYGSGDLTAVSAGVGITVTNGTGPIPTITNSSTDLITTAGDILYGTAADTVARLGIGTAAQVLTVNSGATAPEWATAASGGYTSLATGTLSSSAVNITGISGSYRDLVLVIRNYDPGTDGAQLNIRINNDSGANRYAQTDSFAYGSNNTFPLTFWQTGSTGQDDTVTNGISYCRIFDYANTTTWKMADWRGFFVNPTTTANYNWWINHYVFNQTGAVTQVNILPTTGSFSGGTYTLYGVK